MARRTVAFNIGAQYIKTLEFSSSFKGPSVLSLKHVKFSDEKDWKVKASKVVSDILSKTKHGRTDTVCLIPGHHFFIRRYAFPFRKRSELRDVIRYEMEGDIPVAVKDVVFDYIPSVKKDKHYEIIAFILCRKTMSSYLELFPDDAKPVLVMPELVALANLMPNKGIHEYSLLEINSDRVSMLSMLDGRLRAARSFTSSGKKAETLLNEIMRTFKLWKENGIETERFYVAGSGLDSFDIDEFKSSTGMAEEEILDLRALDGVEDKKPFISLLGLAYGSVNRSLNLLRSEIEEKRRDMLLGRLKAIGAGAAVILALAGVDVYLRYHLLTSRVEALNNKAEEVFHAFLPDVKKVVNPRVQLESAYKEAMDKLNAMDGRVMLDLDIERYLDLLYGDSERAGITILDVTMEGKEVIFEGETERSETIEPFVRGLKKGDNVKDAVVQGLERGSKTTHFRGKITIK